VRSRVALAALALLLALGLPWGVVGEESVYVAGWVAPSFCSVDADGFMSCTPGFVSPGYLLPGQGASYAGYQTTARVTIVIGLLLLALWARDGGAWKLRLAALLQVAAVVLAGTALRSGAVAALIAAAVLLWAARAPSVAAQAASASAV
jgi:hypothetical protein